MLVYAMLITDFAFGNFSKSLGSKFRCFQNSFEFMFFYDFINGFSTLIHFLCISFLSNSFYASEPLLAIEYLHLIGKLYKELKPVNVLVRDDGNIKVSNFALLRAHGSAPSTPRNQSEFYLSMQEIVLASKEFFGENFNVMLNPVFVCILPGKINKS